MLAYIRDILKQEVTGYIRNQSIEKMYGFYLKKSGSRTGEYEVCGLVELGSGDAHSVSAANISYKKMKKTYDELEADGLVIMHNHPKIGCSSSVSPSDEDLIATYAIARTCLSNKMKLLDHIIVDTSNYFSFVENHLIELEI